jgi:hypothetical protein
MSSPTEDRVKGDIIDALSVGPRAIIREACLDLMLILIRPGQDPPDAFKTLVEIYHRYFTQIDDTPPVTLQSFFKDFDQSKNPKVANMVPASSKKSEGKVSESRLPDFFNCCIPCSYLWLQGDRAIKGLDGNSPKRIQNILYADAFWSWFIERMDIDKITGKILSDLEFGGKFAVQYNTDVGIISQIMINEINKGMSSRKRQRTAISLKTIGLRIESNYSGLMVSDIQINPGMTIALQLIAKIENFYNYRRVVQTIEAIAGKKESQQTIASIRTSIELLRKSSEKFDYGTNAHNTLTSIVWKLAGFWLVLATSRQTGVSQQTRFEDIIDTARNTLLLNKIGTPSDKSKTKIYLDCANDLTDFILSVLSRDEDYWKVETPDDNLKIFLDIMEPTVERFIASFKEATGIDLTDKRWITDDPVVSHDLPNKL